MTLYEALAELVVFARENDGEEHEMVAKVLHRVEERVTVLRSRQQARANKNRCVRCEQRRTDGLLCWLCLESAPADIANAFKNAAGVNGMREAHNRVMAWARGDFAERRVA